MQRLTLRDQFIRDMGLRNFASTTQKSYLNHILRFVRYFHKSPTELCESEIKVYLYTLVEEKKSTSFINQSYSALKFLYEITLKKEWESSKIPRSKSKRRLPLPFSQDEILRFFNAIRNIKHQAIFQLIYCGGLRISEVTNLKVGDINRKDMSIRIRQGKGNKERYTLLSKTALATLICYYKVFQPKEYLFPGDEADSQISTRTIQVAFKKALIKADINKPLTVHSIRHSFATHMLESGVDIYHLQKLMGHSNVRTTSIYIHVTHHKALRIQNPHDALYLKR